MTKALTINQKTMQSNWIRQSRCLRPRNRGSNPCVLKAVRKHRNLMVEVRLPDNNLALESQALADLCAEINVRLANSIFANPERARLDMKKEDEDSKKYDFS